MITRVLAVGAITGLLSLTATMTATVTAAADPAPDAWARLRACESSDNYTVVSANGRYYGAYQFNLTTWRSVGGTGKPNEATPTEQDYRALYLYRMRGWQPWTCATKLRLQPDADAASHRVPTYDDAAHIGATTPAWPGKVYTYGDCAPPIRTWQLRMNTYGYHFHGTGCYRDQTRTAVLALQRANGIKPTGQLGRQTWRAAWAGNHP